MTSEVSVDILERDIRLLHEKIATCNVTKIKFREQQTAEDQAIEGLNFYIKAEERNQRIYDAAGYPAPRGTIRYDIPSLVVNIDRCKKNKEMFEKAIDREDASIANFEHMINVLKEDLERPREITFDAKTGQVLSDNTI